MHSNDDPSSTVDADVPAGSPLSGRQDVTFLGTRTLSTVNCRNGRLIAGVQAFCELIRENMTFPKCRQCPRWEPYDSRFSPLSLVITTVYGVDEKDRERAENVMVQEVP
jgi:hypothetical protein